MLNWELLWVLNYYIIIIECMRYKGWNQWWQLYKHACRETFLTSVEFCCFVWTPEFCLISHTVESQFKVSQSNILLHFGFTICGSSQSPMYYFHHISVVPAFSVWKTSPYMKSVPQVSTIIHLSLLFVQIHEAEVSRNIQGTEMSCLGLTPSFLHKIMLSRGSNCGAQ